MKYICARLCDMLDIKKKKKRCLGAQDGILTFQSVQLAILALVENSQQSISIYLEWTAWVNAKLSRAQSHYGSCSDLEPRSPVCVVRNLCLQLVSVRIHMSSSTSMNNTVSFLSVHTSLSCQVQDSLLLYIMLYIHIFCF